MEVARTLGALASVLEPFELPAHSPYCVGRTWSLDPLSVLAGLAVGLVLLPVVEVVQALRYLALSRLHGQAAGSRPHYRLV